MKLVITDGIISNTDGISEVCKWYEMVIHSTRK